MINSVKHVDKLVEIVCRLHDGSKEGYQGNIVALGEELWSESLRLKDRKSESTYRVNRVSIVQLDFVATYNG